MKKQKTTGSAKYLPSQKKLSMKKFLFAFLLLCEMGSAQQVIYLKADRLFDGDGAHEKWGVLVKERKIKAVGPQDEVN